MIPDLQKKRAIERAYFALLEKSELKLKTMGNDAEFLKKINKELEESEQKEGMGVSWRTDDRELEGYPIFYEMFQNMATEIESGAKLNNFSLESEVFVGEFPTGIFNSQTMKVPEGFLVLINSGLPHLIYQFMKIMSFSIVFASFDDEGKPIKGTEKGESDLSHEERIEALVDLILIYFFKKEPLLAKRFPAVGGKKGDLVNAFTYYCEMFAIAHEYGHIIAGHFSEEMLEQIKKQKSEEERNKIKIANELIADRIAVQLMIPGLLKLNRKNNNIDLQTKMCGPLLFLAIDMLLNCARTDLSGRVLFLVKDHPPFDQRLPAMQEYLKELKVSWIANYAQIHLDWISNILSELLKKIRERPKLRLRKKPTIKVKKNAFFSRLSSNFKKL